MNLIEFNEITPAVNQIETHLLCQRRTEHSWMEKYHVRHMAYAPLGQGRKNEMFENPVSQRRMGKQPCRLRCGSLCKAAW